MIEKEELLKAFDSRDSSALERQRIQLVVLLDIRELLSNPPTIEDIALERVHKDIDEMEIT